MINYKSNRITSIDKIYELYPKKEFKSPSRSTIPLLVLFKSNKFLNLELIDPIYDSEIKYVFEFETPVIKGVGSPSCTDLLIEYPNGCIAIEAKWTESPYIKVGKWMGNSINRNLVLSGWLEIINNQTNLEISIKEVFDLPYQLIHRVASACSLKKQQTQIVYIGFNLNESKTNYYLDCLTRFSIILKNKLDLYLFSYHIEKLEEQLNLEKSWDLGERDLSRQVINGLTQNSLMALKLMKKKKINKIA